MNIRKYAKAILAVIGAVAVVAAEQFAGNAAVDQWAPIVIALLTALGVYLVPNLPGTDPDYGDGPVSEENQGA